MTSSSTQLSNLRDYNGNLKIQTADGGNITIFAIGDNLGPVPMNPVYHCPSFTSNLLSIGQLVENKITLPSLQAVLCRTK